MTNPVGSQGPQLPSEVPMMNVKVKPGDEKLLQTPFGRMFTRMAGAGNQDQDTLIKEVKTAMNQYCQDTVRQMQHDAERAKEANERLKRVAQGQDPDQ